MLPYIGSALKMQISRRVGITTTVEEVRFAAGAHSMAGRVILS